MTGIGVLIGGKKWAEFNLLEGGNAEQGDQATRGIAWAETVAIRLGLIMIISKLEEVGGKRFIVLTNNTTSQAAVGKRKSRDRAVNNEWKAIQRLLLDLQTDLVAHRLSTGENMADFLSRGRDSRDVVNRVVIDVPNDLHAFVGQAI